MTGYVVVHPAGARRYPWYPSSTVWGTLEEQIAEASHANAAEWSTQGHHTLDLYLFSDDCPHTNPEDDPQFDGVDDELDEWCARNLPGLSWGDGALWTRNQHRAYGMLPRCAAWRRAQSEYDNIHSGRICLASPMGEACADAECNQGDDDFGIESGGCRLNERARDAWDTFWDTYATRGAS